MPTIRVPKWLKETIESKRAIPEDADWRTIATAFEKADKYDLLCKGESNG